MYRLYFVNRDCRNGQSSTHTVTRGVKGGTKHEMSDMSGRDVSASNYIHIYILHKSYINNGD